MADWSRIQDVLTDGDVATAGKVLAGLDDKERRALVAPLKVYRRQVQADFAWEREPALAIASAAILPTAATLAPWLNRLRLVAPRSRGSQEWQNAVQPVFDTLRDRGVDWLPDLVERLAERLPVRRAASDRYLLVSLLAELCDMRPPLTDGYVAAWRVDYSARLRDLADFVRADVEHGNAVLRRLFEIDGSGTAFRRTWTPWPAVIAELPETAGADRQGLIDACLRRLGSPGTFTELDGHYRVFKALQLTDAEAAARAPMLVSLIPVSASPVAGEALERLVSADRAGLLETDRVWDAAAVVFSRTEKKLLRTALNWVDVTLAGSPEKCAGQGLPIAAMAFGHPASDVQALAVAVTRRWARHADDGVRAQLADAAALLPPDLRAEALAAFGATSATAQDLPRPIDGVQLPVGPRDMPPPIRDGDELAAEILAFEADTRNRVDPVAVERILAALVALSAVDREALRISLQPVLARHPWLSSPPPVQPDREPTTYAVIRLGVASSGCSLSSAYAGLARPAAPGARAPYAEPWWKVGHEFDAGACAEAQAGVGDEGADRDEPRRPWVVPGEYAPLHQALGRRIAEIGFGIAHDPRPFLFAEPTAANGLIDPQEFVRRLTLAAEHGWEPWPFDFEQALCRLAPEPSPELAEQARALGTEAGKRAADRLLSGYVPFAKRIRIERGSHQLTFSNSYSSTLPYVNTTLAYVDAHAFGLDEPEEWLTHGYYYVAGASNEWTACWPLVLPNEPDLTAAHVVPHLSMRGRTGHGGVQVLPVLAQAEGPMGPATALALTQGLAVREAADRLHAVEALVVLAARHRLNAHALGAALIDAVDNGDLPLGRATGALREIALVAPGAAWAAAHQLLAYTLTLTPAPSRQADLLELAVGLARDVPNPDPIPGLREAAERRGSSRSAVEARRLLAAIDR